MFDWFRKKKNVESQVAEDTALADNIEETHTTPETPESEADESPAADLPVSEAAAKELPEDTAGLADDLPPSEPPATVDDINDNAESKVPTDLGFDSSPSQDSQLALDEAIEPVVQVAAPEAKKGFLARFREKMANGEPFLASAPAVDEEQTPAAQVETGKPEASAPEFTVETECLTEDEDLQAETETSPIAADDIVEQGVSEIETEKSPVEIPRQESLEKTVEETASSEHDEDQTSLESETEEKAEGESPEESKGIFRRFKEKLTATRNQLAGRIENLLSSVRSIDEDLLDELEELLITSDLGVKTTGDLLYKIRGQVASKELGDAEALKLALKKRIKEMVDLPHPPRPQVKPMVIMVVGINGVGKTTTIAKLARRFKEDEGQKVLLAAGDTFRSAAVDQLGIWAERLGVDIVSQPTGADASAVVFDALSAAQARGSDVVIIDTAGRLHTKVNLMDELKKIKRVANKALPGAPHHTILVLDGNTGQNAMRQAQTFHEAVGVDSIIVTKLDGTAKGGVIVSICNELKIPIAFVGLGESFEDLQPFNPDAFTEAILTP